MNDHNGFVDVAKVLQHEADPNKPKDNGFTPLLMAAQNGFVDVAKVLLEHEADPNMPRDDGLTPLLMAAQKWLRRRGQSPAGA